MDTQVDRLGKVAITVEKDYWNRDKCYDKLVIVEKEDDCAYLSRKPVPAGISVADREYWIKIGFNTGGVVNVTTTFNPSSVTINKTTTVNISVSVNSDADSINVYRGTTLIGNGSGANYSCNDSVTPTTTSPIRYEVEVTIDSKVVTKSYSIIVNKDVAPISWSKSSDIVNVKDAASHVYPVLSNPQNLSVTYTSTNASVASIDASTGVITLHNIAGTTQIKAVFAGNEEYSAKTVSYTLTVLTVPDYYVGWTTGTKAQFAAKTNEELIAGATDYSTVTTPVYNGSYGANNIFYLMYQQSKAPTKITLHSGGQSMDQDIVNDNTCPHADVVTADATYKIFGIRLIPGHDPNDAMTLRF